jgi:hypothetical protein
MRPASWLLVVLALAACELQEVTVVDFSDVVVGEVYVMLAEDPADHRVSAFLHGTAPGGAPDSETFNDALVRVARDDGFTFDLGLAAVGLCVDSLAEGTTGSCFVDGGSAANLTPGDELDLAVTLGDGRTLFGAVRIPGDFQLDGVSGTCRLEPDTLLELRWTSSDGAWAYVNETSINGLPEALAAEDIEVEEDPLYLLGLSISASDTTVVFPSEFGVFDRFDLEQDLALRLQRGLPDGTDALVTVAAVERNYTNWARGGNFNPSGQVRVASLRGDGTGVFGAAVVRSFAVVASASPNGLTDCPLP